MQVVLVRGEPCDLAHQQERRLDDRQVHEQIRLLLFGAAVCVLQLLKLASGRYQSLRGQFMNERSVAILLPPDRR